MNLDAFWVTREVLFLGSLCVLPLEGVQFYPLSSSVELYELYLPKKMLYRSSHPLCRGDWEMGTAIAISCTKCSQVAARPYPRNCSGSFTEGNTRPPLEIASLQCIATIASKLKILYSIQSP